AGGHGTEPSPAGHLLACNVDHRSEPCPPSAGSRSACERRSESRPRLARPFRSWRRAGYLEKRWEKIPDRADSERLGIRASKGAGADGHNDLADHHVDAVQNQLSRRAGWRLRHHRLQNAVHKKRSSQRNRDCRARSRWGVARDWILHSVSLILATVKQRVAPEVRRHASNVSSRGASWLKR